MTGTARDHWITTEKGTLFARRWTPPGLRADRDATLLLFHDSLGCVELWRDFPEQLAIATGRSVVAYDRLGFGRSEAYPSSLALTFIRDEAASVVTRICESLGLQAIIPFGHSVGGGMAVATAACLPERCAAVIAESAQSFVEDRTLAGLRTAQAEFERRARSSAWSDITARKLVGFWKRGSEPGLRPPSPGGASTTIWQVCIARRLFSMAIRMNTARSNIRSGLSG
jgi:pimeloyl-ACP methyl ester carboxylesterase